MFNPAGFAGLGQDLFRRRDGFLLFAIGQMRRAGARFLDHLLRLGIGLRQNLGVTLLGLGQLLLDLLRIQMRLCNLLPALLEHTKNWFVGKGLQQIGDDNEANYLREEELGVPTKELSSVTHSIAEICRQEYRVHKLKMSRGANASTSNLPSLNGLG